MKIKSKFLLYIFSLNLLFFIMATNVFASSVTCVYKHNDQAAIEVYYRYGQQITYKLVTSQTKYKLGSVSIQNSDIVDASGNINCPNADITQIVKDRNKFTLSLAVNSSGKTSGTKKDEVLDDKEKGGTGTDSGTGTQYQGTACIYKAGTNAEYSLTWSDGSVVVNMIGSKYRGYCQPQVSGFTASDFANGKCPSAPYDFTVSRDENGTGCRGRLIVSTTTIFTDNDKTTALDATEDIYTGERTDVDPTSNNTLVVNSESQNCDTIFGDKNNPDAPAYWIQYILDIMKYIAIGALLLMSSIDFFKAMTQDDKDAIKKASNTTVKRLIYCVLLFFLPTIVNFVMELLGAYGTCGIK